MTARSPKENPKQVCADPHPPSRTAQQHWAFLAPSLQNGPRVTGAQERRRQEPGERWDMVRMLLGSGTRPFSHRQQNHRVLVLVEGLLETCPHLVFSQGCSISRIFQPS